MPETTSLLSFLPSFDLHFASFIIFMTIILTITTIRMYLSKTCGKCTSQKNMAGKLVVITGSNTGIGKETARDLAKRGARVILACRNLDKAKIAVDDIIKTTANVNVVAKHCDLASFKSVRNFADDLIHSEECLDVLICNAGGGAAASGGNLTEDGFECQFQTNHLGHFLLVNLLLDLIKKSPSGRIVVTSSLAHRFGRIDLENIAFAQNYSGHPFLTYCDTKLANVLFTKELARRLKQDDTASNITVNCLHPGTVYTNSIRYNEIWYIKVFLLFMCFLYGQRTEVEGAQTIIHLSVSDDVEGVSGQYFSDCRPSNYNPLADDEELARKLWSLSLSLCCLPETKERIH